MPARLHTIAMRIQVSPKAMIYVPHPLVEWRFGALLSMASILEALQLGDLCILEALVLPSQSLSVSVKHNLILLHVLFADLSLRTSCAVVNVVQV